MKTDSEDTSQNEHLPYLELRMYPAFFASKKEGGGSYLMEISTKGTGLRMSMILGIPEKTLWDLLSKLQAEMSSTVTPTLLESFIRDIKEVRGTSA